MQRKFAPEADRVECRRNPSWLRSAWLGLYLGVFCAPSSFLNLIVWPIGAALMAAGYLVGMTIVWCAWRLFLVIAGLSGFLTETKGDLSCPSKS